MPIEMKDSGVEWIEQLPQGWDVVRLKTLFTNGKGLPITKENLVESGVPVISYGQIHAKFNSGVRVIPELLRYVSHNYLQSNADSLVKRGDFIVADTSEDLEGCGNCVYVDTNNTFFAGYHTIILKAKRKPNQYLAYLFLTDAWRSQIRSKVSGVKLFSISKKILMDTTVILPPSDTQMQIVEYLDGKCKEIDTILEKTQASIESYKQLKQALISKTITKGIHTNRKLKDSGITWVKEVPSEWGIIPSKYLFQNTDERRVKDDEQLTASQKYGIIPQTEYMELENSKIVLANKGLEDWKHVEPNDFIISLRSFQGGLEMSEVTGCITWHYIVLRACKPICPRYYKWLFKSSLYIKALQRTCNFIRDGQDLRYSNFVQVPLFEPPLEEQEEIAAYLDKKCAEIDSLIAKKEQLITELENYKKSLIYEYVTGKKEVPQQELSATITFLDRRALLMCRIFELMQPKGRVHMEKGIASVDCLLGLNTETQYSRHTFGPYDKRISEYESLLEQNEWINVKQGSPVTYSKGPKFEEYREAYQAIYGSVDVEIQRICKFLKPMSSSQAGRVAALLAVWNDFILDQITPTPQQLIQEVRTNWTPNKAHSPESTWQDTLNKIQANGFIPTGKGLHTVGSIAE